MVCSRPRNTMSTLPLNIGISMQAVEVKNGNLLTFTNPITIVVP